MLKKSWSFPSTKLIYAAAVLYVLSAYLIPILFLVTGSAEEDGASTFPSWILLVPIILGLVNLTIVLTAKQKIQRKQLLVCSMIIKYGLIPFMQFFFTMDVIFITVLAIKEKKQAAVKK